MLSEDFVKRHLRGVEEATIGFRDKSEMKIVLGRGGAWTPHAVRGLNVLNRYCRN